MYKFLTMTMMAVTVLTCILINAYKQPTITNSPDQDQINPNIPSIVKPTSGEITPTLTSTVEVTSTAILPTLTTTPEFTATPEVTNTPDSNNPTATAHPTHTPVTPLPTPLHEVNDRLFMPLVSAVPPKLFSPQIIGCPVFPADNIWNTPIDKLPVDPHSYNYINSLGYDGQLHPYFGGYWRGALAGKPFIVVPGDQPRVPITFTYWRDSDPGPYPIPSDAPIEGGGLTDNSDRTVFVIDKDNCKSYEIWKAYVQPDGSWKAGAGAVFDLRSNDLRPDGWTSADAAGLPFFAALVKYDEIGVLGQGVISHALRFTANRARNAYIWPGRHQDGHAVNDPNAPPFGQRFRLKASFDISGFSPQIKVILQALKTYGMFLADEGSSWQLVGTADERWNQNMLLEELHRVHGHDFEAIDESSLMIDPNSAQARRP